MHTYTPTAVQCKVQNRDSAPHSEISLQTTDITCRSQYKGSGRAYQHIANTGVCIPEAHDEAPLAFAIPVGHDGYH